MFLHRVQSTYGRLIPKPQKDEKYVEILDEAIPIQDQIEALRAKIQLKERYNRVLKDELEESRLGASSILQDLYSETHELHVQLVEALNSGKAAVQNALRTHRDFQLAMSDKPPHFAIEWLDDKLFDLSKQLNYHLWELIEKRRVLEDAEDMVLQIEKWPRPGSLPWEVEAIARFHHIESMTANMKVMLETANILHANYYDIKFILREEKGKYAPVLRSLDEQLRALRIERATLQKMLDDAIYFREEAFKNLAITEKEASENRKIRRRQMTKMKKKVAKCLEANQAQAQPQQIVVRKGVLDAKVDENAKKMEFLEKIRLKRVAVEEYQERAKHLVQIMRVHDLTFIPDRFRHVMALGVRLKIELEAKEQLRDLLLRHKDQLYLILSYFSYTGVTREEEFKTRKETYNGAMTDIEATAITLIEHKNDYGNLIVQLKLIALAVLDRLDEGRRRHTLKSDFLQTLKKVISRVSRLVSSVKQLNAQFRGPPTRNYSQYIKNPPVVSRLVRVGTPVQSDESDEDEFLDMKIPTREEIKAKSARVIHQGLLKKGYH